MRLPAPAIDHPTNRCTGRDPGNLCGLAQCSPAPTAMPTRLASGIGTFRKTAVSSAFV
jgi:hypothetical protein